MGKREEAWKDKRIEELRSVLEIRNRELKELKDKFEDVKGSKIVYITNDKYIDSEDTKLLNFRIRMLQRDKKTLKDVAQKRWQLIQDRTQEINRLNDVIKYKDREIRRFKEKIRLYDNDIEHYKLRNNYLEGLKEDLRNKNRDFKYKYIELKRDLDKEKEIKHRWREAAKARSKIITAQKETIEKLKYDKYQLNDEENYVLTLEKTLEIERNNNSGFEFILEDKTDYGIKEVFCLGIPLPTDRANSLPSEFIRQFEKVALAVDSLDHVIYIPCKGFVQL